MVPGNYKAKYAALVHKYNRLIRVVQKNNLVFKRLVRNYALLRQRLLARERTADRQQRELLKKSLADKYTLILDHRRRVSFAAEPFLEAIEMSRDEFASSFYIDTLFECHLPNDFTVKDDVAIPEFHFPFMLTASSVDEDAAVHPFAHYALSGLRKYDPDAKLFRYYLNARDISSEVELDYFQKTDRHIRDLSATNLRLEGAKKTIEMHKLMLISLVCSLIEDYNRETSVHLQNIRILTGYLTEECDRLSLVKCAPYDQAEYLKDINYTSVLHDIGKMGVPKEILSKDGALTASERAAIQKHPRHGAAHIKKIIDLFEDDPAFKSYGDFLRIPYHICLHHHERWDGGGYPEGLAGDAIPFCARVVALVDCYDAMRMRRSYNRPKNHSECVRIIREESGRQFDPAVVKAFLNIETKFEELEYD